VRATIEPTLVTLKDGKAGEARNAIISIRNLADKPLRVLGFTTSCTCISGDKLPVVISPKGLEEFHVTVHLVSSAAGRMEQSVVYHTDNPSASSLMTRIVGRVTEP
jgi:hypothetical protein